MNWSMPRPVLQGVAAAIAVACLVSFGLGVATAPPRSRLPGERALAGGAGQVLQAQDAIALGDERIEGPAPPPELSDEEKARLAEEKERKEEEAAAARAAAAGVMPVTPATPVTAPTPGAEAQPAAPATPPPPKVEEPVF